jgi:hypothetical protein
MKTKNVIILLGVLIIASLSTCNKEEILEKPVPPGQKSDAVVYKDVDGMRFLLNSAYKALQEGIDWHYTMQHFVLGSFRSDDAVASGGDRDQGEDPQKIAQFNILSNNERIYDFYKMSYISIRYCNIVINNADITIKENPDKASTINDYVGQAYTLRAFNYFMLARNFGKVVITLDQSDIEPKERSSVSKVFDQILDDLNTAIANEDFRTNDKIFNKYSDDMGRMNKDAAKALKVKVYMKLAALEPSNAQSHFTSAYNIAKEVINSGVFALVDDYSELWGYDGKFTREGIIEIGYPNEKEATGHQWYATWLRPRWLYKDSTWKREAIDGNRGWGFNTPTQDFVNAFHPGDPRLHWTVFFQGDSTDKMNEEGTKQRICFYSSKTGYFYRKTTMEKFPENPKDKSYLNHKIYRYADLLLLGAEAANEIDKDGSTSDALTWLNMVRERARNTQAAPGHETDKVAGIPADVTITDKNQLRDTIRLERRIELGCEGERFYDLLRWHGTHGYNLKTIIESAYEIVGPDYELVINKEGDTLRKEGKPRTMPDINVDLSKHLLLPIPKNEVEVTNGVVTQNPGY